MKKFFETIASIHQFTMELDRHFDALKCHHCLKSNQFVSHGFVYKKQINGMKRSVGKRIFCSNRYGRSGCGSTYRLYTATEIPSHQYNTTHLFVFLLSLLDNLTVKQSYQRATNQFVSRNAWRWLDKLFNRLIDYRCFLNDRVHTIVPQFKSRVRRLQILLPTVAQLFDKLDMPACSNYQLIRQSAVI